MNRVGPALVAVLGAILIIVAALLPEFSAGGEEITPVDPDRIGWVASLVGTLVHVGLLLVAAAMLALAQGRGPAGGILVGAGILGLTIRLVRIVQLGEAPEFAPAIGSWVDLLGDAAALTAGVLALTSSDEVAMEDEDDEEEPLTVEPELPPPPGEPI